MFDRMKLTSAAALFALTMACDSNSTRAEAREDVVEARNEARTDAQEVMERTNDPVKQAEKVAKVNEELADDHRDAYRGVGEQHAQPGENQKGDLEGKYPRFEAMKGETDAAFLTRADTTLDRLETDLRTVKPAAPDAEEYNEATASLATAKEEVQQAKAKPDDAVFDGRVQVAVAINHAQREASEVLDAVR